MGCGHCLLFNSNAKCQYNVCVVITRPAGVLFRIEITAGGWHRLTSDQVLRALDNNGWIRYSGPLHRGVTQDENGDIMMTVTEEP